MQFLLTSDEYAAMVSREEHNRVKQELADLKKELELFCPIVANFMPPCFRDNDGVLWRRDVTGKLRRVEDYETYIRDTLTHDYTKEPEGCIYSKKNGYCDLCPSQHLCPIEKSYSK